MIVGGELGGMSARRLRLLAIALLALLVMLCGSARALADVTLALRSGANTTVQPGGQLTYNIQLRNVGTTNTDGSDMHLTATLPDGLLGVSVDTSAFTNAETPLDCGIVAGARVITCTGAPFFPAVFGGNDMRLTVQADPGAAGVLTTAYELDGGGAPVPAHTVDPVIVTTDPPVFGFDAFDAAATKAGIPLTQAGGHPDSLTTSIDFNTHTDPSAVVGDAYPVEDVKDAVIELPPGLVGNPTGLGECTQTQLANGGFTPQPLCPPSSQVGTASVRTSGGTLATVPVFNMAPPPGAPARFAFNVAANIAVLDAHVRSGSDYGLGVTGANIPQGLAISGTTVTLWGVPSDPSHDAERGCSGGQAPADGGPTCTNGAARKAFFRNPTSCTAPGVGLVTTAQIDSWQQPGVFKSAQFTSHEPPGYPFAPSDWGPPVGIDGCDVVPFTPVLRAEPLAGAKAGAPSGFAFDISVPQDFSADAPTSQSDLRKVTVTLPEGVRVSPPSANGLGACSSAQIALRSTSEPTCPDNSKLGSVTIDTPLLDVPVTGSIYLARPFDNPFNALVAVYVVASAKGVMIKLPGLASMNLFTGQISTTFDNNPQLPFSNIHVEFRGGPRAPLVTPKRCGTYTTHAVLTGWNGSAVSSDSSFTLTENARGQHCPSTFAPSFSAGTKSNRAGNFSSFLLRFAREDQDQELRALTVRMARGLTAKLANADLCTGDQVGKDACPANAKIGDVTVGAGAGSDPFYITNGRAYLTGPYKGAPFGVAIVVPAVAGPFDLGKVTVRSALFVDKHDASVRIVSDPFPAILQGIPLDVRDVRVDVNKPSFFLNPTSCAEKRITGTLTSTEGASANVSDRFQAADCASLGFKPRMTMRVGGRGHTHRGQTSPFTTTLTMPQRNQANLRLVRVTLPQTINARLNTINDACTRAEFEGDVRKCAHAKAGSAVASTPLLRAPLKGTVYFVKNGHPIPDLFVALRGEVDFDLIGRVSIPGGKRLATTFDAAPDVPIRSFKLSLLGGPTTASIGAAANLCSASSRRAKAEVDYIGQNGKVRQVDQALEVAGCKKAKKARKHRSRR
ncbi:MAG TPA: hypothetical protein VKB03_08900 [Conexibacter sp.]|nr:hypothetical protein [Conexibacter sp.]